MATQAELYSYLIAAGGSPEEARILSSIAMDESGGQSIQNYQGYPVWGPYQIHLGAHPEVSIAQANDPRWSSAYALKLARARGNYEDWEVYVNNPAKYEYAPAPQGVNAMPGNLPPPPAEGPTQPGNPGTGGDIPVGTVLKQFPDGTAIIYDGGRDDWGNPTFKFVDISNPASQPRSLMNVDGLLVDPVTGRPVADYRSAAATIGELPTGYAPIRDTNGRIIQGVQDPSYVSPVDTDSMARGWQTLDMNMARNDRDFYEGQARDVRDYGEGVRRYDQDFGESTRRFDVGAGLQEGLPLWQFREGQRQFDTQESRLLYQFDANLNQQIENRLAENERLKMSLASADARAAKEISAQIQMNSARIASDQAIARMDNATKLDIAKMQARLEGRGQDVQQRGQDIGAQTAYRGQDITREGNILQARGQRAQYGVEALRNDPIAQATFLLGGDPTARMTPAQYAIQQYQIPDMPAIGAAPALPDRIKPVALRDGGAIVESNEPVLTIVGETDPSSAEAALLAPGSVVEPLRLSKNASQSQMEEAALRAVPRLRERAQKAGIPKMAEGGTIAPWSKIAQPAYRSVSDIKAKRTLQPVQAQPTTPVTPVAPAAPQLRPEDALISQFTGLQPTNAAGLEEARQTVRDALTAAMYGPNRPEFGQLPGVDPVFGVEMTQPEQLAASFYNRPQAARRLVTSAWGMRNMPEEEFYRRMRAVTPEAIRGGNPVQYARHGIAVRPVRLVA